MRNSIRKNTLLGILITLFSYCYPIITFLYIARLLHPDGLGSVSFAASFSAYFVMITGLGMPLYGLRASAARRDGGLSSLAAELFLIRAIFGVVAWLLFSGVTHLDWNTDRTLFFVYGLSILFAIPECEWLFKGMEDYADLALITLFSRVLGILALFLFVRTASDAVIYAWITVLMGLGVNLAQLIVAEKRWRLRLGRGFVRLFAEGRVGAALKTHLPSLLLFFLMSCAVTIYSHTDTVMLGFLKGTEAAGLYACAAKVKSLLPMVSGALWAAALPKAGMLWRQRDQGAFCALAERSFHAVQVVMCPLALYFFLFAGPCVRVISGSEYSAAALPMRLLILAIVPIGVSNIAGGQILISMGEERLLFRAELIGALSNIALNAALIPFFSVSGAAAATTLSETLVAVFALRFVRRFICVRPFDRKTMRSVALGCALACISLPVLLTGWPDIVKLAISLCVFALCYVLVMLVRKDVLYVDLLHTGKKLYHRVVPRTFRLRIRRLYAALRTARYRAKASLFRAKAVYECPCCGIRLQSFVSGKFAEQPERYDPRRYQRIEQDVLCPVCGALPRHRILAAWCNAHFDALHGAILYFALEDSMARWMRRRGIACSSADLYEPADLRMDIEDTKQPDSSWDWVFCNHVLEHVENYEKALREIHRILKPGGHLICSFPIDETLATVKENPDTPESERIAEYGQFDHLRIFGRDSEALLRGAGFEVSRIAGDQADATILPVRGPADYDVNYLFLCEKHVYDT